MSAVELATALHGLVPAGVTHYEGQPPSGAAMPWVVSSVSFPGVDSRSDAATPHAFVGRLRLTIAGGTEAAVQKLVDRAVLPLEGIVPVAAGWDLGPLLQLGEIRIYPDVDVTLQTGHPMVGSATFEFTATRV